MMDDQERQGRLKQLRELYDDGTLTLEKYRAKLLELGVDPALIPGQPLQVAGDYIDRSQHGDTTLVTIGTVENMTLPGSPDIDPAVLRHTYLKRLIEQVGRLPLTGIDPKTASDAASGELQLSAVYTALLTQVQEMVEVLDRQRRDEHKPRYLSALEMLSAEPRLVLLGEPGSGKSTFVNFVALCLAGEALGLKDANLATLTAPLPQDERERDKKPKPQPWAHGALLPVRIALRDLAARGLPANHLPANGDTLWHFIVAELGDTLKEFAPHLKRELLEQGGLILLDGLDEVPDAHQRRAQVKQVVQDFARCFPRCRVLVTSRTYAYQRQDWKLDGFAEAVLSPFSPGQIDRFVASWYAHIGVVRHLAVRDSQARADLLQHAIRGSTRLQELAGRPLLLTLMTSLHAWRGGSLPEKREELYADAVDLLLDQWESPKVVYDAHGKPLRQPSLAGWLKIDRAVVRAELNRLAYAAQRDQPQLVGTADIDEGRLVSALLNVAANRDANPVHLVAYLRDRAGLVAARGEGVYTFPHRTFQEYLAACYLTDHGFPDDLATLARADPNRWREVTLLAGAKASRGSAQTAWYLAEALCFKDFESVAQDFMQSVLHAFGAFLAAQTLLENEGERLKQPSEKNAPKLERIRQWLQAIVEFGWLPPLDRAQAGNALAILGDDRDFDELISIPAGPFLMGNAESNQEDEKSQCIVVLPRFKIGKYPVTSAQYARFATATGRAWAAAESRRPEKANHPAVAMRWRDACDYCEWITRLWRVEKKIDEDEFVRLPTEGEWEKAARGEDGRLWPWGNDWGADICNNLELGLNTTTTVGIFPAGSSPTGCLDMAGNVREWTNTAQTMITKPNNHTDYRILRGGSFLQNRQDVQSASRVWRPSHSRSQHYGFRIVVANVSTRKDD